MDLVTRMQPRPAKVAGNLVRAGEAFERSERASAIKAAGCQARLDPGQCGRIPAMVVAEDEEPGPLTPAWRLHGLCSTCAQAMGLLPEGAA